MNRHIIVIGGGQSVEHEVSLASAAAVSAALRRSGSRVIDLTIGRDGVWTREGAALGASPADSIGAALAVIGAAEAVYPVLHGAPGEDGAIAGLCALAGVPVAGSPLSAGGVAIDKHLTKQVAAGLGIATAPGCLVTGPEGYDTVAEFVERHGDVVVKPVSAGSSHGVRLVRAGDDVCAAIAQAARLDERVLVEPAIRAREIDVAVLRDADGTRFAAPPLEILADGLFDTTQKYDGSAHFVVPASIDAATAIALRQAALRMFDALGCGGVARLDFFVTGDGVVLNEVNTTPGMTEHSQVPRMFAAAGIGYDELVTRIVRGADAHSPVRISSLSRG